jgi:hypothetical protein
MSMSQAPPQDDRLVEEKLRQILEPYDRHLDRLATIQSLALVVVVPATFLCLWLLMDMMAKHALGWAAVGFGTTVVLALGWDALVTRLACRRFDRYFPHDSPVRGVAVRILSEMQTPSRIEEKLREKVPSAAPARIVRHSHASGQSPGTSPAAPVPPALPPVTPDPATGQRPGGYYDYIPLEPRTPEEPPGEKRG